MIKFTAQIGSGTVVGLGLSRANCEKLLEKKPIRVVLRDLGLDADIEIILLAGGTEQQMANELRELANIGEVFKKHCCNHAQHLFVGDRPEDEGCAKACGTPFMWAEDWRAGKADPAAQLANVGFTGPDPAREPRTTSGEVVEATGSGPTRSERE